MVNLCTTKKRRGIAEKNMANYGLITMGKHASFQEIETSDGFLKFDHTFKQRGIDESYENEFQMNKNDQTIEMMEAGLDFNHRKALQMSDHIILWLYHVRQESAVVEEKYERPRAEPQQTEKDKTHRTYFIGAVALNLVELLKATKLDADGAKPLPCFEVKHNFCNSSVKCEVHRSSEEDMVYTTSSIKKLEELIKKHTDFQEMLYKFDVENKLRPPLQKIAVVLDKEDPLFKKKLATMDGSVRKKRMEIQNKIDDMDFKSSPLKYMAEINELVQLEQVSTCKPIYPIMGFMTSFYLTYI